MFEVFDKASEMIMVFKDEHLFYANETALFIFNSYKVSLINMSMSSMFEREDVAKIREELKQKKEFQLKIKFNVPGTPKSCKFRVIDEFGEDYLLIQTSKPQKEIEQKDFIKIISPKSMYDPLRAGKISIMNYELSDPCVEIKNLLDKMLNGEVEKENIKKVSKLIERFYEKTRMCMNELSSIEEKYALENSVFGMNDLLCKITNRLNNYFLLENIKAEISYEAIKKHDAVVSCDYNKIAGGIITLITLLINLLNAKNKKANITLELIKEKEYCTVNIIAKDITITKKVYDEIINSNTEIINLDRYKNNKITMNICLVNAYVELNGGELYIKRDKKEGTTMSIKLPLVKKRYFVGENDGFKNEVIDNIIKKIMLFLYEDVRNQ